MNHKSLNNPIDMINEIISIAKEKKIVHQFTQDFQFDGRNITIENQGLIHFGSCSYLGLETDDRIKVSAIEAVSRYGSQFSCSRTYLSFTMYKELEDDLEKMFEYPIVLSPNSTMGHLSVIPIIIEEGDAIILDHQAHISMQDVALKMKMKGIPVLMLRHNRLDELEEKIKKLKDTHNRIWYFIDSVYSMYGDLAPLKEIRSLQEKYPKLWLYADDAHGMSWKGKNGTGYFLSTIGMNSRTLLATSLAKGFASAGGVFVFPNEEMRDKVKTWGGPLTYSGPQQPAVVGASIASAQIHLSSEINVLQDMLAKRINHCNELMRYYKLPLVAESESPIFFVGLGLPKVGYNMVKKLFDEGLFVNLGVFPAVPETCTGIRFTLSCHHTLPDIERLVETINKQLPIALKEEGRSIEDIHRAFKNIGDFKERFPIEKQSENINGKLLEKEIFKLKKYKSIKEIDIQNWNALFGDKGIYDWDGLCFLEAAFSGNMLPEDNWLFYYYIIEDKEQNIVLATFFTETYIKEDIFAQKNISQQIEETRKEDPYYLTSKSLMMGSLLTEGDHLYVDRNNQQWNIVLMILLDEIWKEQENNKFESIFIRDFDKEDIELRDFFIDRGFVKTELPQTSIINVNWTDRKDFLLKLPSKKRNRIQREVVRYENHFNVYWNEKADDGKIKEWYELYEKVRINKLEVNSFRIPEKLFKMAVDHPNWEIMELYLKPEYDPNSESILVAFGLIYKSESNYCPVLIGLDYQYSKQFHAYRQMLFKAILRGQDLGKKKIYLGITSVEDKQKFGAESISKVAYIQQKDHFNSSVINSMVNWNDTN